MACASVAVISTRHVLTHRPRRHSDPELDEELMSDSFFAPADVRDRHLDDQLLELFWHRRTSFASRFPPPKQTKSFPVPADERVGLHDDEGILPVEQPSQRRHREPGHVLGTARRLLTLDEECELLSEKEILRGESTLRTDEIPSEREGVEDNGHNIREQSQERAFPRSELTTVTSSGGRETADPGTSKPRNQRRIEFLRSTGENA